MSIALQRYHAYNMCVMIFSFYHIAIKCCLWMTNLCVTREMIIGNFLLYVWISEIDNQLILHGKYFYYLSPRNNNIKTYLHIYFSPYRCLPSVATLFNSPHSLIIIKWGKSVNQNQQTITIELNNIDIELINWSVTQQRQLDSGKSALQC